VKIDAHQHFWRYTPEEYGWIDEAMQAIRANFLPENLLPVLSANGIDGTVVVQARQVLEETRWLLQLAGQYEQIKGVVGWVPLSHPDVADLLGEFSQDPHFKGVRHVVQAETDPAFLDGPGFNAGLRAATKLGLSYDLLIVAGQLPAAIKLVDRHPQQLFVLDHLAKPEIHGAPPAMWCQNLRQLALRPNVTCKLSGLVTEVPGWKWTPELLRPYVEVVLEAFGPRRLMFGSDWPVCLVASTYAQWMEFVRRGTESLSLDERDRLFGGTAAETYRLKA